jgi:Tfp pilus assembly PilM family ATPase
MTARLPAWLTSSAPAVGVEIAADRVVAVSVATDGDRAMIARHAVVPLPPGLVTPSLTSANVADPTALAHAVGEALSGIGRPRRVALAIPDAAAKVSLLRFEHVPARPDDLDRLVRWQMKKAAPFAIEEAQVGLTEGAQFDDGSREYVVTVARRDIVREYETACAGAGAHAGIVDLATFNLINLVLLGDRQNGLAGPTADWLLVHVARDSISMAVVRDADVIFFRNRPADGDEGLADQVHQTRMYYEDRLGGGGWSRVLLGGSAGVERFAAAQRDVEARVGHRVALVDPQRAATLADRIMPGPDLLGALAAPAGLALREAR